MKNIDIRSPGPGIPAAGVLTAAFGTTVSMWAVGYVGRLPAVVLSGPFLLSLMLGCVIAGGAVLARSSSGGFGSGALVGLVTGVLNLLILGSFLSRAESAELIPSAAIWVPGSILVCGLLGGLGAAAGRRLPGRATATPEWPALFARVAIVATLLLLAVGGLVTSNEAGLAVVDWPNSFGYNMFLYPFSRMTGPIYYEHAHRLFGALVGLTTLVLALLLSRSDPRRWVRRIGWAALAMVSIQGLLGGLRVTGHLTLSETAEEMGPSLGLALVHGVLAQIFFGTLVAIGAFTSAGWRREGGVTYRRSATGDRFGASLLAGLIVCQLVLGAAQRHFAILMMAHIVMGVAIVAPAALHVGIRAWGLNPEVPILRRLGLGLVGGVCFQLLLGFGAYVSTRADWAGGASGTLAVTMATAHQWFGAVLFALAVALMCWNFRLVSAASDPSVS